MSICSRCLWGKVLDQFWAQGQWLVSFSVFDDVHWLLPWPRESTPMRNVVIRTFYSASVWFDLIHVNHWIDWKKVGEQHRGVYRCVIGLWRVLACIFSSISESHCMFSSEQEGFIYTCVIWVPKGLLITCIWNWDNDSKTVVRTHATFSHRTRAIFVGIFC